MGFYLVELEGTELGFENGPVGFFANRFVRAASPAEAVDVAKRLSLKVWAKRALSVNGSVPQLRVLGVESISPARAILSRKQNHAHVFYNR